MKFILLLTSLFLISCTPQVKKKDINKKTKTVSEIRVPSNLTFEEIQDSLRIQLLNSKPDTNLKSNMVLQELYIRGLVKPMGNTIKFELPFNLHGFDCGAPDCYTTNISFEIARNTPVKFPKTIKFTILEHGCGINKEVTQNATFELMEQTKNSVNYYSKKLKSNLVIQGKKRALYYFTETHYNQIKIDLIDQIINEFDEEDENSVAPYQSTIMTRNEYETFIKNE